MILSAYIEWVGLGIIRINTPYRGPVTVRRDELGMRRGVDLISLKPMDKDWEPSAKHPFTADFGGLGDVVYVRTRKGKSGSGLVGKLSLDEKWKHFSVDSERWVV